MNCELPDVQAGFRKGRGTRDQIANICWIILKAREFQKNINFCFIDYAKAFDCVDDNKLWKILKEVGIPDHLTCLLRNLYAGQEATVRTGHGTTDWFQIGKGVRQGCILSPCLFNLCAEYMSLEKEMATHSSVLAWRIPGTGEPGRLPSMGSHRVGHDWSDLAVAAIKEAGREGGLISWPWNRTEGVRSEPYRYLREERFRKRNRQVHRSWGSSILLLSKEYQRYCGCNGGGWGAVVGYEMKEACRRQLYTGLPRWWLALWVLLRVRWEASECVEQRSNMILSFYRAHSAGGQGENMKPFTNSGEWWGWMVCIG